MWTNLSKFALVCTACIPGVPKAPITRGVLRSYLDNMRVPTGFFTEGSVKFTVMYLHCSACENYINSIGYGACSQCHRIGKIFTKCCNKFICRVPHNIRVKKPDCKWNIKYGRKICKAPRNKQLTNQRFIQAMPFTKGV